MWRANLELNEKGLVVFSFGNASGIDRESGLVAIKPSGVDYGELAPDNMVLLDLEREDRGGGLNPSSDTKTHLRLYRAFGGIGGVVHTHSRYATAWAQAMRPLPCLGTTHADYFYGEVPCTEVISDERIARDYEDETGRPDRRHLQGPRPRAHEGGARRLPRPLHLGEGPRRRRSS